MMPWRHIWSAILCAGALFAQNNLPEKKVPSALPSILHITSDPSGAKVYINNTFVGLTPFQDQMNIGTYNVIVKKEFFAEDSALMVLTAAEVKSQAFLLKAKFGIIDINSAPESGADVFLNNVHVGITPYNSQQLPEGEYSLRMTKLLFKEHLEKITLADGKTDRRIITLENNSCSITVRSAFSTIFIDGNNVGDGSHTAILEAGKHTIIADRSEQYIPIKREIILNANDVRILELEPQPRLGGVSVIVHPENAFDAEVFVNDTIAGKAPIILPLIVGTHTISVKKRNFRDEIKYFTVSEDEHTTVKFQMITLEEDHRQNINKWNYSKWISAGIGTLAIGASLYFNHKASTSYSAYSTAPTTSEAAKFRNQTNQHKTYFSISAGFASAAAITTVYSWIKEQTQ